MSSPGETPHVPAPGARLVGLALGVTLCFGVWMRWFFAGKILIPVELDHLRHAHSHLGYFGVLFPLAWGCWRAVGAEAPGPRALALYAGATGVATLGFLRAGYGPEAIVGSTVVGGIWLWSGWRLRGWRRAWSDPLGVILPGIVVAQSAIPPIALLLRRDPVLARAFVSTFLAALLLMVLVPSALAAQRIEAGPWPLLCVCAGLGAAMLGVWPAAVARAGLGAYALLIGWGALRADQPALHDRVAWGAVAIGLLAVSVGLLPNTHPVAIGSIHFVILAPVLGSLAAGWLRRSPPPWAWLAYQAAVALLAGPLIAQGLGAGGWTLTASAVGGTLAALWWAGVGLLQLRPYAVST